MSISIHNYLKKRSELLFLKKENTPEFFFFQFFSQYSQIKSLSFENISCVHNKVYVKKISFFEKMIIKKNKTLFLMACQEKQIPIFDIIVV